MQLNRVCRCVLCGVSCSIGLLFIGRKHKPVVTTLHTRTLDPNRCHAEYAPLCAYQTTLKRICVGHILSFRPLYFTVYPFKHVLISLTDFVVKRNQGDEFTELKVFTPFSPIRQAILVTSFSRFKFNKRTPVNGFHHFLL